MATRAYTDFVASDSTSSGNIEAKPSLNVLFVKVQLPDLERFSSFLKLKRVYSYVLRFIINARNYKSKRCFGTLSPEELEKGESKVVHLIQNFEYGKELHDLKSKNVVHLLAN
mgnify:CR=1 FL=1